MSPKRVLLVDDDPNIIDGLRDILEDAGCNVHSAASASEALHKLTDIDPRVAIVDFQLPDATGLVLAQQMRSRAPGLIIWLMTGMATHELGTVPAGVLNDILTKPVDPASLLDRLQKILGA